MKYEILKNLNRHFNDSDLPDLEVFITYLTGFKLNRVAFENFIDIVLEFINIIRKHIDLESSDYELPGDIRKHYLDERVDLIDSLISEMLDNVTVAPYIFLLIKDLDFNGDKVEIKSSNAEINILRVLQTWQANNYNSLPSFFAFDFSISMEDDIYSKCLLDNIKFRTRKQCLKLFDSEFSRNDKFIDILTDLSSEYEHQLSPRQCKMIEEFIKIKSISYDTGDNLYKLERNGKTTTLAIYYLLEKYVTPMTDKKDILKVVTFLTGYTERNHRDYVTALFEYANKQMVSESTKRVYDTLKDDYDPQVRNLLKSIMFDSDLANL